MNLFTKQITAITFEDIEEFCSSGVEEGLKVEYKEDFPNNEKMAKEISAFANTYGGILIVGIKEEERKPILPIIGIDISANIHEKITSIAMSAIEPPCFPEIQICKNSKDENKVVVLIRIQESDETPHTVKQGTGIYIRIASQSEPSRARFEEIEWLRNRREKAVENRIRLLERAETRFLKHPKMEDLKYSAFRKIHLIPLHPSKPIIELNELIYKIKEARIQFNSNYCPNESFPYDKYPIIAQNESIIYVNSYRKPLLHVEFNQFGLVYNKESFSEDTKKETERKIRPNSVLKQIYMTTLFCKEFYKAIGYWGSLEMEMTLNGIHNRPLIAYDDLELNDITYGGSKFDNDIIIRKNIKVHDLIDNSDEIILYFYKTFLWSCGTDDLFSFESQHLQILENVKKQFKKNI